MSYQAKPYAALPSSEVEVTMSLPLVRGGGPPQVVEGIVPQAKLTFYPFTKKHLSERSTPWSAKPTIPTFQGEPICCGETMNENRKKRPS